MRPCCLAVPLPVGTRWCLEKRERAGKGGGGADRRERERERERARERDKHSVLPFCLFPSGISGKGTPTVSYLYSRLTEARWDLECLGKPTKALYGVGCMYTRSTAGSRLDRLDGLDHQLKRLNIPWEE